MSESTPILTAESVKTRVDQILSPLGFESHLFLVDWYNQQVAEKFRLDYGPGTLACVVISQPSMFEKAFIPFVSEHLDRSNLRDPIDQCMLHYFGKLRESFGDTEVIPLHDFQLTPQRRPKILVQTAGHVSGAVRFFRPCDFDSLREKKDFYPVCHHPRWGGWFALRGVLIFPQISNFNLNKTEPPSVLSETEACSMLEMYNLHWQDWRWRDVGGPEGKYSQLQIKYFETPPAERSIIIDQIIQNQLTLERESV